VIHPLRFVVPEPTTYCKRYDARKCEAKVNAGTCGASTNHNKPYCPQHIALMPYAQEVKEGARRHHKNVRRPLYKKTCQACGDEFATRANSAKWCEAKCKEAVRLLRLQAFAAKKRAQRAARKQAS
jgi:hypothetical protein